MLLHLARMFRTEGTQCFFTLERVSINASLIPFHETFVGGVGYPKIPFHPSHITDPSRSVPRFLSDLPSPSGDACHFQSTPVFCFDDLRGESLVSVRRSPGPPLFRRSKNFKHAVASFPYVTPHLWRHRDSLFPFPTPVIFVFTHLPSCFYLPQFPFPMDD